MTLKDFYFNTLSNIVEQMEMIDLIIDSDSNGNIRYIDIKYSVPKVKENK